MRAGITRVSNFADLVILANNFGRDVPSVEGPPSASASAIDVVFDEDDSDDFRQPRSVM